MAAIHDTQEQDHAPQLTVTQARGAGRGRHVAWILGISMALIVIGFTGLWFANAPRNAHEATQPTVDSRTAATGFQAPPPQPRQSDAGRSSLTPGIGSDGRGL
jgi:hypothetical protein